MEEVLVEDHAEVAGHTFTAQLPGDRCLECGTVAIPGEHVRRFELCVAAVLAKSGQRSHAAFRYMRAVLDLTLEGVAQLCSVDAELVELWESGRLPVGARALALVAGLVISKCEGRGAAVDSLALLRGPRALARQVRISLGGGHPHAIRGQDFGGDSRAAPALA